MPTYVFKCEGCGGSKPFLVEQNAGTEATQKLVLQKHCPTCRTTTRWVVAGEDRRAGDRRGGTDRRSAA